MFELDFSLLSDKYKFESRKARDNNLDYELNEELEPYLYSLQKYGHINGAKTVQEVRVVEIDGQTIPIFKLIFQIDSFRFNFKYSVNADSNVVFLENFEIKRIVDMEAVLEVLGSQISELETEWDLPQADRPTHIIKALELLYIEHNTSLKVGKLLGHKGKKSKDIARHGCYKLNAAINLGLAERYKENRKTFYRLTEKGLKIAKLGLRKTETGGLVYLQEKDIATQYRLLVEAMLAYPPVRTIFEEVIQVSKELDVEKLQMFINEKLRPSYYSLKTSYRRAQCLMTWLVWMSMITGIPVVRTGDEGSQLTLKLF